MEKHGYEDLAEYYDTIYSEKDYKKESEFIGSILKSKNVRTILDVGCGTGNHLVELEKKGFVCEGLDLSEKMLKIAKEKIKAKLHQGDMRNFSIKSKFDAIICLYAAFNHNLNNEDAEKTISCFKNHLNNNGTLIIDLHNPQKNGKKIDEKKEITREIEWSLNKDTKIEESSLLFRISGKTIQDSHKMKIYSIQEISKMIDKNGFKEIKVYENFTEKLANSFSKNLVVFANLS